MSQQSQYHQSPRQPGLQTQASGTPPSKGLGVLALVLGAVAFVLGWVPFLGFLLGAAAVVAAMVAWRRGMGRGLWLTGLALGSVALVTSLVVTTVVLGENGDDATDSASVTVPSPVKSPAASDDAPETSAEDQAAAEAAAAEAAAAQALEDQAAADAEAAEVAAAEAAAAAEEQAAAEAAAAQAAADAAAAAAVGTVSQQNAYESAQSYLDYSAFSRTGLIGQLSSEYGEGYPVADAEFAVGRLEAEGGVDWNAEAAESAQSYLDYSAFSRQGLIDQLTSEYGEGFTLEQAEYAVTQAGL